MNEQTVQELVLGQLQGDALDGVERHLAECSSCAELVAVVARRTGSADSRPGAARPRPSPESRPSIAVGTVMGRFVILEFVGAGGMGEVYAAYDPNLERRVAIKFLRPELIERREHDLSAERMRREARLVAKLSHPNVVAVYEIDVFEDRLFIVMEYVDGQSVSEWLKAESRVVGEVVRVFLAAGAGLSAAHAAGVIHRDFKPHNVMLAKGGDVRVMDFGLAHLDTESDGATSGASPRPAAAGSAPLPPPSEAVAERDAQLTRTGTLLGTPAYMAPEQLLGQKASARTDQYSFCVALYEALFGRRPPSSPIGSRARAAGTLDAMDTAAATRSVPARIRKILKRGLAEDPAQRYASMDDLLAELRVDKTRRRRIALAALASLVLAGGVTWGAVHERSARGVRICRAVAASAALVWPLQEATPGSTPPGAPAAMREAFDRSGVADATEIFARVSRTLSTYLGQWSVRATDACEATHVRGEQSRDVLALRMACLDERIAAARALVETLVHADAGIVTNASDAALGLPDLDRCSELGLLRGTRVPIDPAKQAQAVRLRNRMAELKLLAGTGHYASVVADIKALERDIRGLGYQPLLADFLLFVHSNSLGGNSGAPASRPEIVREALRVSEEAGYEEGMAEALVGLVGVHYRDPVAADLAFDQADALMRHLGSPLVLRAWLENNASLTLFGRGRLADALQHAQRSLALKEQRTPRDVRDIARTESNICMFLQTLGQPQQGLPHCERAVQLAVAALGWNHPHAMNMAENLASVGADLDRLDEACPLADRVLAFFQGAGDRIDDRTSLLLTLARCAASQGHPAAGRQQIERALSAATRTGATPMELADVERQLSRAAFDAGDHHRAFDLAEQAARRYLTLPELAFRAREVRGWIANHDAPSAAP